MANFNVGELSPKDKELAGAIIGFGMLVLGIIVAVIYIAQIVFWISVTAFFGAIIYLIIGIFIDIERTSYEDYFDGFPHALLAVGVILLFWIVAHLSFPIGYSPTSYKILEFAGQVEEIQGIPQQIMVLSINETCNVAYTPICDTLITTLKASDTVENIGDTARVLSWVFNLKTELPRDN